VWRGPDLGGYDLHGPKAVACFGAELGKGNGGLLRTFTSVADDLDDVLRETDQTGRAHRIPFEESGDTVVIPGKI
jgi:hypothetical protein